MQIFFLKSSNFLMQLLSLYRYRFLLLHVLEKKSPCFLTRNVQHFSIWFYILSVTLSSTWEQLACVSMPGTLRLVFLVIFCQAESCVLDARPNKHLDRIFGFYVDRISAQYRRNMVSRDTLTRSLKYRMGRFLSGRLEQYSERIYTGMTSARGLYLLSRRKKQPHLLTRSIQLVCNEISQARVSGR